MCPNLGLVNFEENDPRPVALSRKELANLTQAEWLQLARYSSSREKAIVLLWDREALPSEVNPPT